MKEVLKIDKKPQEHIKTILSYFHNPKGFMLLAGLNGRGKSFAAEAIAKDLSYYEIPHRHLPPIKGYDQDIAWFINQHDLNELFIECEGKTKELSDKAKKCMLLILDDLGTRSPSAAFLDFLYGVIDFRSKNKEKLGTIITTNMNSTQMRQTFGDAILDRIGCDIIIKMEGHDYPDRRYIEF